MNYLIMFDYFCFEMEYSMKMALSKSKGIFAGVFTFTKSFNISDRR